MSTPDGFELGAACRPLAGGEVSGDVWDYISCDGGLAVVVADGAGHGLLANDAARKAVVLIKAALEREPEAQLDSLLRRSHEALRGSRGAALAICRFDIRKSTVAYCGVGNTCLRGPQHRKGLGISLPGTVGSMMRSLRVFESELLWGDFYALHTDGVSSALTLDSYGALPAQLAAERILDEHGKESDDACVVVVRRFTE